MFIASNGVTSSPPPPLKIQNHSLLSPMIIKFWPPPIIASHHGFLPITFYWKMLPWWNNATKRNLPYLLSIILYYACIHYTIYITKFMCDFSNWKYLQLTGGGDLVKPKFPSLSPIKTFDVHTLTSFLNSKNLTSPSPIILNNSLPIWKGGRSYVVTNILSWGNLSFSSCRA